jgi:hypothetical protein
MSPFPLVLCLAAALAACAGPAARLPVCDGKHRRPVNLQGSILDPTPAPAAPPTAAPPTAEPPAAAPVTGCGR